MKIAFLTTDSREHYHEYHDPAPSFGAAPSALLEGFAGLSGLEVHVISCVQQRVSSPARLAANISFHSLYVPKLGWLRTGYSGCILATRRKLREIQPHLVHGQGTERDCGISAIFSGYPSVITIHGNMAELARRFGAPWAPFQNLAAWLENFTLPRTSGVFCNSLYTQQLVRARNPRTWLVPNPLGLAFFAPCHRKTSSEIAPTLLVVGVICARKRQQELLAQLLELRNRGFRFHVRWIGHCPKDFYGRRFLELVQQPVFSVWNSFEGLLDQPRLIQEMDAASALVHFPSEESFGLVAAEALARGLKVFASRIGGLQEICAGPTGAVLVSPEDWCALREAIAAWLQAGCPLMAGCAAIMKAKYHPSVIAQRHLDIYREVVASR